MTKIATTEEILVQDDDRNVEESIRIDDKMDSTTEASRLEYDFIATPTDYTLEYIAENFGEKIIVPSYQRDYAWNIQQASALIESFIIGLPVPQLYLFLNSKGNYEVIDGQQRITSIKYFLNGRFPSGNSGKGFRTFRLTGLLRRSDLNGKTFEELDYYIGDRLVNSTIRAIIIMQSEPIEDNPELVYHIFERLNAGGTRLSSQEIRNVMCHGEIRTQLEKLNSLESWRKIFGKLSPDPKQRDIELILRLFALFENSNNYQPPMRDFLTKEMSSHRSFDSDKSRRFAKKFVQTCDLVIISIENPFRPQGPLNAAALEAVMGSLMEAENVPAILTEGYEKLMGDDAFQRAILSNTTSRENVMIRKERATELIFKS